MIPNRSTVKWLALSAALAAGCDLPTSAPKLDQTWILPIKADTIRVAQFLPASVDTGGGVFTSTVKRDSILESLGQMCSACAAANGTTTSLPAFSVTLSHTDSFPAQVLSITPGAGLALSFRLDNGLGFDPLRPGIGKIGSIVTLILDSAGATIARDSVDGSGDSLPSGTSLTRSIPLGGSPIGGHVTVAASISVPGSDPVLVDTSKFFRVTTLTDTVALAGITVQLSNRSVQGDSVSVDWSNIGSDITSKMQAAELKLILSNPFTAAGTDSVFFRKSGTDIIPPKTVAIAPGVSTSLISVSQAEIQTLADSGRSVVQFTGNLSGTGPSQSLTITPTQVVVIKGYMLVTLLLGGN